MFPIVHLQVLSVQMGTNGQTRYLSPRESGVVFSAETNLKGCFLKRCEKVNEILLESNAVLLSEYKNTKSPITIKFLSCGHTKETDLEHLIRKQGCNCDVGNKKRKTNSDKIFNKLLSEFGKLKYILTEIEEPITWKSNISYICEKGHFVKIHLYSSFMRAKICKKCSLDIVSERFSMEKSTSWKGG